MNKKDKELIKEYNKNKRPNGSLKLTTKRKTGSIWGKVRGTQVFKSKKAYDRKRIKRNIESEDF